MDIINLGNMVLNNYVLPIVKGYLVIDTGYQGGFPRFCERLKSRGIGLSEISYILLTHAHDDHAGYLNELLGNTPAQVILHPVAVERLAQGQHSFEGGCTGRVALGFCKLMALVGSGEHKFPPVYRPDRYIILDESTRPQLEQALGGQLLNLPGHTADSIGFLKGGHLFCGDAAMNGIPSINRMIIWVENLRDYKASWELMIKQSPARVYPSHGRPFNIDDLKRNLHKVDSTKLYPLL